MSEREYRQMFGESRDVLISKTREEILQAARDKDWKALRTLIQKLKKVYIGDDVFWANEVASNSLVMLVMGLLTLILGITTILTFTGVYQFQFGHSYSIIALCIVQLIIGILLNLYFKGERHWIKYLCMFLVCATCASVYTLLGSRAILAMTIPVVLSVRYFSVRLTRMVSILMGVFLLISTIGFAYLGIVLDLNVIRIPAGTVLTDSIYPHEILSTLSLLPKDYMLNLLERSLLPGFLQFLVVVVISLQVAKWGHKTILTQAEVSTEFTRMDTELNLARDIQVSILPNLFPPYPDRKEFEIFATMNPAREVGGDFYDFFLLDSNHLCMVMADVSGKGVPAALFMMISKVMIKTQAMQGLSPAAILNTVNAQLCENNKVDMFVTTWVGILEINTGILIAANAGHEYPVIYRKTPYQEESAGFHLFKDKHGLVLGGMEGIRYREYSLTLREGDSLFLYTDGVTEAINPENDLFGTDRMLEALNHSQSNTQKNLLLDLRREIDHFAGEAEQFDDITMLGLKYNGKP